MENGDGGKKVISVKEKFLALQSEAKTLRARIIELENIIAGPPVSEISIQTVYSEVNPLELCSFDPFSISPDVLLASEKIEELEQLTQSLQEELRKNQMSKNEEALELGSEIEALDKRNSQLEATNAQLQGEIDRLTTSRLDSQSEIRRLKAELSEKQNSMDKLAESQRKLAKENTTLDSLLREKEELNTIIHEVKKAKAKSDEQISLLSQKLQREEAEKANLVKELTESAFRASQHSDKEALLLSRINSTEASLNRCNQQVQEHETKAGAMQMKNAQLRKENIELIDKLATAESEIRKLAAPGEDLQSLRSQNLNLRKQIQILTEKIADFEAKTSQMDRRNLQLSGIVEKAENEVIKWFGCSSIQEAALKFAEIGNEMKQSQKDAAELRVQIGQMKSLKLELAESHRKVGDLQHNADFMEARFAYVKQVVIQLLTAPFSQREKVADVLIDLLAFGPQEKEVVMKSLSNGKDLSSRLLYVFEPWM